MTNKIEIPINKAKVALLLIVPLILLISGAFIVLEPESFASSGNGDLEKAKFMGIAGGAVGLILLIIIAKKWFIKNAGLTIDQSGITDTSNASYTGLVEWNDITRIEGKTVGPLKLIVLHTDKPEKYINKAKKTAMRQMRKNHGFYGSPILLVSSRLKIKYADLLGLINKEFEKRKGHVNP